MVSIFSGDVGWICPGKLRGAFANASSIASVIVRRCRNLKPMTRPIENSLWFNLPPVILHLVHSPALIPVNYVLSTLNQSGDGLRGNRSTIQRDIRHKMIMRNF